MKFVGSTALSALPALALAQGQFGPQVFKSDPARPPILRINKLGGELAPGFLTFQPATKPVRGAYLMTDDGELVYAGHGGSNFRVARLNDKKVLTSFFPTGRGGGHAYGYTTIMDDTYNVTHKICPQLGLNTKTKCQGDLHESFVTNDGKIVVTAYNVTRADLSSKGGPSNGYVLDGQFYQIDIETGEILFSWKSLDHIPLSDSKAPVVAPIGTTYKDAYDYFHINSVQAVAGGQFLVSGRDVSSVYLIASDGSVVWQFAGHGGGTFGDLPMLPNGKPANFAVQHDARLSKFTAHGAVVHFFNNNNPTALTNNVSAGMEFFLNTKKNSSRLLRYLYDPKNRFSSYKEGDYQPLPNRNVFLGYGNRPIMQEFGPQDDLRMTIAFGPDHKKGQASYRATKQVWHAVPHYPPSVVVDTGLGYVSWNGATNVTSYDIYAGSKKKQLEKVDTVPKSGFETSFQIPANLVSTGGYVQVAALDGTRVLRRSAAVQFGPQASH